MLLEHQVLARLYYSQSGKCRVKSITVQKA